jgi:hypothetical protein
MASFSSLVAPVCYRHIFSFCLCSLVFQCMQKMSMTIARHENQSGLQWQTVSLVRFDNILVVTVEVIVLWNVMPHSLVDRYWYFAAACHLHLSSAWRWRQNVTAKCWYLSVYRTTHHNECNLKVFATKLNYIPSVCGVFESGTWRFKVKSVNKFYIIFPQSHVALLRWKCQYC